MTNWLGVVSADHVRRGVELGIAQLGHGRGKPLARLHAGDTLVYYSPTATLADKAPLRHFTAIGTLPDDEIWQAEDGDFRPFRRRVDWEPAREVPLAEVREALHLTTEPNWGYRLRLGLVELDDHDTAALRAAMGSA
jgi:hypothetical protein